MGLGLVGSLGSLGDLNLVQLVLHLLGAAHDVGGLKTAQRLRTRDLRPLLGLLLDSLLQILVLLQRWITCHGIILLVLREGPLSRAVGVRDHLHARRVLDTAVDRVVARGLPVLSSHLRVARAVVRQEARHFRRAPIVKLLRASPVGGLRDHVVLRQFGNLFGLMVVLDGRSPWDAIVDSALLLLSSFSGVLPRLVCIQVGAAAGFLALLGLLGGLLVNDLALGVVKAGRRCHSIGCLRALLLRGSGFHFLALQYGPHSLLFRVAVPSFIC